MVKLTNEEKTKLKEEGYKLTFKALITIIIANIVFVVVNIFKSDGGETMRSNQWFGYFMVGVTILVPLIGFRKERKEYKNIRQLTYTVWFLAIILFSVIFNAQLTFSNALRAEETVHTNSYKVEDIKVVNNYHLSYKVTYEKNGKLKTVTLSEEEGKEYKDYNRYKPTYKLEVTEYSYTKEFKKKYPDFEGRASKQKLILERSGE